MELLLQIMIEMLLGILLLRAAHKDAGNAIFGTTAGMLLEMLVILMSGIMRLIGK